MICPPPLDRSNPMMSWLDKLRAFVRSLEPLSGFGYRVKRGSSGWHLEIDARAFASSSGAQQLEVTAVNDETLTCRSFSVASDNTITRGTTDITVAKPWDIRCYPAGWQEVITLDDGTEATANYTYVDAQRRFVLESSGLPLYTQRIIPRYLPKTETRRGSIIHAITANNTGVSGVSLIDVTPGRAWTGTTFKNAE